MVLIYNEELTYRHDRRENTMKKTKTTNSREQVKQITDELEQGVRDMFASDRFQSYLDTAAKFHRYSALNCYLIMRQCPDATRVAGFTTWKTKFNRNVKKGEKAIRILAPCPHKKTVEAMNEAGEIEEREIRFTTFRAASVFDVSQTEGDDLPDICVDLVGTFEAYNKTLHALKAISPVPIEFEDIRGGSHGYYNKAKKIIAIRKGMSETQTLKTLVHEIAHAMLHGDDGEQSDATRRMKEVQAEAVAYTVCKAIGLDTSDYSFGYIVGWSEGREAKELIDSLETIRRTAARVIDSVEEWA